MPRKRPFSAKAKKTYLQEKRAEKRGEVEVAPKRVPASSRPARSAPPSDPSSRKLQSRFIALSPEYLERTRNLAYSEVLHRPIPAQDAVFPVEVMQRGQRLSCPGRPKFKFGQTKKEVEKNEESVFRKWLETTEDIQSEWMAGGDTEEEAEEEDEVRSPSWFESNLEVWRQLWRVTESSQILLLLIDSRCPPLHCPPSLRTYVQKLRPRKEVILVLTKSDLVDPDALQGWKDWIRRWWEGEGVVDVVSVMSYDVQKLEEGRGRHLPHIPPESLDQLVQALKRAHERLLEPPDRVKEDSEKLARWKPAVRSVVDWGGLTGEGGGVTQQVGRDEHTQTEEAEADQHEDQPRTRSPDPGASPGETSEQVQRDPEHEPLTIGLIGQPNVGKSSLLNALFGTNRVRASKTPGKTKHFQTLFWGNNREIKIVDCPGLVCPSLAGLEIQALAGILPLSQIPSMAACIRFAAKVLPIEEIFSVPPPEIIDDDPYSGKKTWRGGPTTSGGGEEPAAVDAPRIKWTAGGIMESRALDRGFITAKGGRPDGNRAANGMMRMLAEGKVRWGFWPPDIDVSSREGKGIWLSGKMSTKEEEEEPMSDDANEQSYEEDWDSDIQDGTGKISSPSEDDDEVNDTDSEDEPSRPVGGFFAALELEGSEEE